MALDATTFHTATGYRQPMTPLSALLAALLGCGAAVTEPLPVAASAPDPVVTQPPRRVLTPPTVDGLGFRLTLVNPEMITGMDPDTVPQSRLGIRLWVRNLTQAHRDVVIPAMYGAQFAWTLTNEAGMALQPVFLPPPTPLPPGSPAMSVQISLDPGAEAQVFEVGSIFGFQAPGSGGKDVLRIPPPGHWEVAVSGTVGSFGLLEFPPLPLDVKPAGTGG